MAYKTITVKDFGKICRTCLGDENTIPILKTIVENIKANDLLDYTVQFKVNKPDYFPQNICKNCLKELYRIYLFKKRCNDNKAILNVLLDQKLANKPASHVKTTINGETINITVLEEIVDNNVEKNTSNTLQKRRDLLHTCQECKMVFKTKKLKRLHLKSSPKCSGFVNSNKPSKIAKPKPDLVCNKCQMVFESKQLKNIHCKENHSNKPTNIRKKRSGPVCKHCLMVFESKQLRNTHYKENPVCAPHRVCPICGKKLSSRGLLVHMRTHTKEKPYQCNVCGRHFSLNTNLKRHKMTHTGERPHVCQKCGKGFIQATSLKAHLKLHSEVDLDQSLECEVCGRCFQRHSFYRRHLETHNNRRLNQLRHLLDDADRPHVCDICKRRFRTPNSLKSHQLRQHSGTKAFLCSDCGKSYVTNAALQLHVRTHTGERPYPCPDCGKAFKQSNSLHSHMLIHTGHRPYLCKYCSMRFIQPQHLKYHLLTHTGERPYKCQYCNKAFALKGNLTVHVRTHTGETPYVCPVCNKGFYDSSSLKKHRRSHQGAQVTTENVTETIKSE